MNDSEIRRLLHQAAMVADPRRNSPRNEQEMRKVLGQLVTLAGSLLDERDQFNRRLRRSAWRIQTGIAGNEHCAASPTLTPS